MQNVFEIKKQKQRWLNGLKLTFQCLSILVQIPIWTKFRSPSSGSFVPEPGF